MAYNKQPLILFQTRKRSSLDIETNFTNFHSKTASAFFKTLIRFGDEEIRSVFCLKNLPVLIAMIALDPHNISRREDPLFEFHGIPGEILF